MSRHRFGGRWVQSVVSVVAAAAVGIGLASVSPGADTKPDPKKAPQKNEKKKAAEKKHLPPAGAPVAVLPGVTDEQVTAAIAKAQEYLLKQQNKEGNWEEVQKPQHVEGITDLKGRQWGGLTSIATYALLASGVDPRSTPELQKAINFLLHANITSTYALGLSSQIVLYINEKDPARGDLIKRNVTLFEQGMNAPSASALKNPTGWPANAGFYTYGIGAPNQPTEAEFGKQAGPMKNIGPISKGAYDRSNSQYGVLGMWALAEAGGEVSTLYWQIEDNAWKHAQHNDGGWDYTKNNEN
ncbi:MAG TPA: hypothetical protein VLJ39_12385, partial [Tepidisphaeraceae bacterium]|nr:hypothetical protein [Tepidisphaeraceae bacterium]